MRQLEDTDPIPLVLAHLRQDERVQAMLTGGHVSGIREAPWPCLVVEPGPSRVVNPRGGVVSRGVSLALYDSFEEAFGSYAAFRLLLAVIQSLTDLAEDPTYDDPAQPVITGIVADGSVYAMASTAGQQRYITELSLTCAPAQEPSPPVPWV